jgi:hypothetical protein
MANGVAVVIELEGVSGGNYLKLELITAQPVAPKKRELEGVSCILPQAHRHG